MNIDIIFICLSAKALGLDIETMVWPNIIVNLFVIQFVKKIEVSKNRDLFGGGGLFNDLGRVLTILCGRFS